MLRFYFYMIFTLTSAFACINEAFAQVVSKVQSDISVSVKTKDASAKDANDGYIHLDIRGGIPPYSVNIFGNTINHDKKDKINNLELKNLTPGYYLFIIQDRSQKIIQQAVTISSKN
jgi:hypothetical protein